MTRQPGVEPEGANGLLERLRSVDGTATISESAGPRTRARAFVSTIERAANGLASRGVCPDDVVAILAPVSPARLTAVYTVMAVGGVALPLAQTEPTTASPPQVDLLTATDARLLVATSSLATVALELAERSRVRQVVVFGQAPETTPFEDLLDSGGTVDHRGSGEDAFDSGILEYQAAEDGLGSDTTRHRQADLLQRFRRLDTELGLGPTDVVAVDPAMSEPTRAALVALALWRDVSVVTVASESESEIQRALTAAGATVRGSPTPTRVVP